RPQERLRRLPVLWLAGELGRLRRRSCRRRLLDRGPLRRVGVDGAGDPDGGNGGPTGRGVADTVSEPVRIRPFRPGDEPALMEVCRRTADAGGDSSHLFSDGDLVGTIWCMPYLVLEPDLASVVASGDEPPVGYVLGACDSTAFHHAAEDRYWPSARA